MNPHVPDTSEEIEKGDDIAMNQAAESLIMQPMCNSEFKYEDKVKQHVPDTSKELKSYIQLFKSICRNVNSAKSCCGVQPFSYRPYFVTRIIYSHYLNSHYFEEDFENLKFYNREVQTDSLE